MKDIMESRPEGVEKPRIWGESQTETGWRGASAQPRLQALPAPQETLPRAEGTVCPFLSRQPVSSRALSPTPPWGLIRTLTAAGKGLFPSPYNGGLKAQRS